MDIIAQGILQVSLNSIKSRIKLVEEAIYRNIDLDIKMTVNDLVKATTDFSIDVTKAVNNSRKEK